MNTCMSEFMDIVQFQKERPASQSEAFFPLYFI